MSSQNSNTQTDIKHSAPMAIPIAHRGRGASVSSESSGGSSNSSPITPSSISNSPNVATSPLLSLFMGSPKASTGFPFKHKFGPDPVFEDDEEEPSSISHARRASTIGVPARFQAPLPEPQEGRGANILRRLSLSTTARPIRSTSPLAPPNSAVSPTSQMPLPPATSRVRRSATVSGGTGARMLAPPDAGKPKRAPSPMGERILKGHFDGFN